MTLTSINEMTAFYNTIKQCRSSVWMKDSANGKKYDLQNDSELSKVIGILSSDSDNNLELFASSREDMILIYNFIHQSRTHRKVS